MAERRDTREYRTNGSAAYRASYQYGSAAPKRSPEPERRQAQEPERRTRVQPRTRVATRPNVAVRPRGAVAPFAIIGFAAVALCALLLVVSTAQLAMANDEIVTLNSQLTELKSEEKVLMTQYELTYDTATIEAALLADGSMVKAGAGQTVYLDMSKGDNVVYYEAAQKGVSGLVRQIEQVVSRLGA